MRNTITIFIVIIALLLAYVVYYFYFGGQVSNVQSALVSMGNALGDLFGQIGSAIGIK